MKKTSEEFAQRKNNIVYVSSSFTEEFGEDEILPGTVLKFTKLGKRMADSEILKEFNIQECTLGDVLATLNAAKEDMKDGYSNIFYIKGHSRVVHVHWSGGGWGVDVWFRGVVAWRGGYRVFSPATDAVALNPLSLEYLTLEAAIKICKENGLRVIKKVVTEQEL